MNLPAPEPPKHSRAFRIRRMLNWLPMGLMYALMYMGRYNLNVFKKEVGDALLDKSDFGIVFGVGTVVYAFSFLVNGPLTDRIG
ncbi:MAG: MFS transporter, partial [Deltaproteobacteria bacterium]|nr:MFS transporter [Deltaproteobacteria bacterium]